jgi:hypothetical protein
MAYMSNNARVSMGRSERETKKSICVPSRSATSSCSAMSLNKSTQFIHKLFSGLATAKGRRHLDIRPILGGDVRVQ